MHCTSAYYKPGLKNVDPAPVPGVAAGLLTLSSPSVVANWTDRGRFENKACFVDDAGANWQLFLRSVGHSDLVVLPKAYLPAILRAQLLRALVTCLRT
jgi:hypothetical protein